jgi:PAS domain S-box-containing protein
MSNKRVLTIICSAFVFFLAVLVFAGWIFEIPVLTNIKPEFPATSPNTAAYFLMMAIALFLAAKPKRSGIETGAAYILSGTAVFLTSLAVLQFIVRIDYGIQSQVLPFVPSGSVLTSICLLVLNIGVLSWLYSGVRGFVLQQFLFSVAFAVCFTVLNGYFFGVTDFYSSSSAIGMALPTAIGLSIFSIGFLAIQTERGMSNILIDPGLCGWIVRTLLPFLLLVFFVINYGRLYIRQIGLLGLEAGIAFSFVATGILTVIVSFCFAELVCRYEARQQKYAEEARQKDGLYRALTRSLPNIGVLLFDKDLRYLLADGKELLRFKLRKNEVEGKTLSEIFPHYDQTFWELAYRRALAGEKQFFEAEDEGRHFYIQLSPVTDENGIIIGGMSMWQNVSEIKQIEARLRETEAQFSAFMENMPLNAWMTDENHRIQFFNNNLLKGLNITAEQVRGKTSADFFGQKIAERHFQEDNLVLATGQIIQENETHFDKNGNQRDFLIIKFPINSDSGRKIGGVGLDITKMRRIEAELRETQEHFQAFMDYIPMTAWIVDERHYLQFANSHLLKELKSTSDEIKGKSATDFFSAEIAAEHQKNDRLVLEAGQPLQISEQYVNAANELREVISIKFPIKKRDGQQLIGGVALDITERRKIEESLAKSLNEKETLLKEVHHRVKNNMQIISSLVNMQRRKLDNPQATEALLEMRQRIQVMSLIHEKLYQSDNLAQIELLPYLQDLSKAVFHSYQGSSNRVSIDFRGDSVKIHLEKALPCGLIANEIISNSLKYAFPDNRSGRLWGSLLIKSDHINLEIGDDGIGLSAGIEPGKSSSMGLNLIKALVEQLDGSLEINRRDGTSYKITFKP